MVSSESPRTVADTVVLLNFLLVDEFRLLVALVGRPIAVPRVVFDPEASDVPEVAESEIARSIRYYRRVAGDPARGGPARSTAERSAERVGRLGEHHAAGDIGVIDLSESELALLGRLTSSHSCHEFGLRFPLDLGEAACAALALGHGLTLVTDDRDALKAIEHVSAGHPYERTRRLLIRAANEGLITADQANSIHGEMRRFGFWDQDQPFP